MHTLLISIPALRTRTTPNHVQLHITLTHSLTHSPSRLFSFSACVLCPRSSCVCTLLFSRFSVACRRTHARTTQHNTTREDGSLAQHVLSPAGRIILHAVRLRHRPQEPSGGDNCSSGCGGEQRAVTGRKNGTNYAATPRSGWKRRWPRSVATCSRRA
jgi:hypothetical protein